MKGIFALLVFLEFAGIAIGLEDPPKPPTAAAEAPAETTVSSGAGGKELTVASPAKGPETTIASAQALPIFTEIPPDMIGCSLGECQGVGQIVGATVSFALGLMLALRAISEVLTLLATYTKTTWENPIIQGIGVVLGVLAKFTGTFSAGKTQLWAHSYQGKQKT